MLQIEIKIKGAGMTFSNELYLIEKILKERGYDVEEYEGEGVQNHALLTIKMK